MDSPEASNKRSSPLMGNSNNDQLGQPDLRRQVGHMRMNRGGSNLGPNNMNNGPPRNGFDRCEPTEWVMLKGMPFKISDRDVMDFFSDIGLIPSRVHLALNQFGQSMGECFVQFNSHDDALRACAKNGMPLGMSAIDVNLIPKSTVDESLGIHDNNLPPQGMQQGMNPDHGMFMGRGGGFRGMPRGGPRGGGMPFGNRGNFRGRGSFNRGGRGGFNNGPPGPVMMPPGPDNNPNLDGFGAPGCVLTLENVPFRAGIEEILNFFVDYNITRENVIRRYNEAGSPTGDAKVAFQSPAEAKHAFAAKMWGSDCKIRDRRIFLQIT